ncbi:metalloprotease [Coemansia sp. RSA 2320]|nr:metalloprotease [Coemansia sp. RSA 2320]
MDYFKSFPLPDWTSNFESRKTTISQLPYEEYMGSMEQASAFINLPFDKEFFTNELNEVDSDQMKVQSNNLWRDFQLAGKFAELDHSNAEFMQWCIAALKSSAKTHGLDLYDELLKYYTMYYSSDIMKLAVHGKRSLDQMVEWTVAKFSAIKSKGNSVQIRSTHPVSSEFLGKVFHYKTTDDTHILKISFPVPEANALYRPFFHMLQSQLDKDLFALHKVVIRYEFFVSNHIITIYTSGLSWKLPYLLKGILEKLAAFSVDTEQFAAYKKEYVEKSSFDHPAQPDKHCLHNLSCITEQSTWHYKILEDEIDKVTPVMLQEHVNSLFKGAHTKMTVIGNFYENDALKAADTVQAVIGPHKTIEDIACLKSVVKSDLLEFWDKHINPNTAPGYMRVDSQMWSSGTWYPSASDMAKYSARTLALYGCMHDEGNTELDIAMVDKFISNTAAELLENPGINISADDLVGKLKGACLSEYGARYISGSDKEKSKNTKDALQIAINDYESPFVNRALCNADIVDSGAVITPDGVCLLTDYAKFQSTQKLHDLVRPVNMPEPKYSC